MADYLRGIGYDIGKNLYHEIGTYTSDWDTGSRIDAPGFVFR